MQPAVAEVVQTLTFPASAATASARFGARRSLPWCGPPARGSPKSSWYCTGPTTGKMIPGFFGGVEGCGPFAGLPPPGGVGRLVVRAEAEPAATVATSSATQAVVRGLGMGDPSEARDASSSA